MSVKQVSWNPTAQRLESNVSGDSIKVQVVCPDAVGCNTEIECMYKNGPVETVYTESKFPVGDDIVAPLGCGMVFTIRRDERGFYIEEGDTRRV